MISKNPIGHDINCAWQLDQNASDCTCGRTTKAPGQAEYEASNAIIRRGRRQLPEERWENLRPEFQQYCAEVEREVAMGHYHHDAASTLTPTDITPYSFRVFWSEHVAAWIAICDQILDLSYQHPEPVGAIEGLHWRVADYVDEQKRASGP